MNFFDLHADTPLMWAESPLTETAVNVLDHPFSRYVQTLAVFVGEGVKNPFSVYRKRMKQIHTFVRQNRLAFAKKNNFQNGILLSVENAAFLAQDPGRLYRLVEDGVSMLGLTWNGDNALAGGADGNKGLTMLGREVIAAMNRLGLVLDISHLSKPAAFEAAHLADRVLASHSNADAVFSHRRNLSEETLAIIKQKNGLVGLCFYPAFLGDGDDDVFSALLRQVEYLCWKGMEKNIAIGTDFDGATMAPMLSKTADILRLQEAFLVSGVKKALVDAIFYENALAFFQKICKNKYSKEF